MSIWLKQSTAADVLVGPFVDDTDFKTAETALTISQADIRISKNGAAFAQTNNATGATHRENGHYIVPLDTTDTNTLGRIRVAVHESGALAAWQDFMVVPANVWDSLFGADFLQVDTREVGGTTQTAGDIIADTNDIQTRLPAALVSGRIDASVGAMAANVMTAAAAAADLTTELQSGLATSAALATVDTVVDAIKAVTDLLPDAGALTSLATQASVDTIDNFLDTEIAAILADTNELQTDWVDGGRLDLILDARASQASVDAVDDFLDTEVAAILADTNELQTDWVDGGRLDLILDARASQTSVDTVDDFLDTEIAAIKAKTDNLPADPADASDIAASFTTVNTKLDTIDDFLDTEVAAVLEDTSTTLDDYVDDLEDRLTAALATVLQAHALGVGRGVVDTGSTTTAIVFKTVNGAAASGTNDFYNGRHIVFTSGALTLQATSITDYVGATKTATVPAVTGAPAEDVTFIIV
jgi:hypothetical protein